MAATAKIKEIAAMQGSQESAVNVPPEIRLDVHMMHHGYGYRLGFQLGLFVVGVCHRCSFGSLNSVERSDAHRRVAPLHEET